MEYPVQVSTVLENQHLGDRTFLSATSAFYNEVCCDAICSV